MAAPDVRIVSLTITEKGYCHEPATGMLKADHPDIQHDLSNITSPKSAPGMIVSALQARHAAALPPFTVLSCDNLPSNGQVVRGVILDFARSLDPDLAQWIEAEVPFPSTMVDRITPATTQADITHLAELTGYHDPGLVVHEPFGQWVIEDAFAAGRPAWEQVGVQMVRSVDAHETMKLRCLNGTHSALAYLGYLAGYETIADTVGQAPFAAFCQSLWTNEIVPTVPQPEGEDLPKYCDALLARYRNTAIRHRTWQIAMDGSQKLPQRLLDTIRDNLAEGRVPQGLCLAVAAWMRYVGGVDETGAMIDVRDPLAVDLKAASDGAATSKDKVAALLAIQEVFGTDLVEDVRFRETVERAYLQLMREGAQRAVEAFVA